MRYRLQTFFGTFYADTEREIRDLQGMFRGLGHNVTSEVSEGVIPDWETLR